MNDVVVLIGGLDNYLLLIDLKLFGLIGKVVEKVLDEVGIIVNKNIILFEMESLFVISGICVGVVVVIICGFDEVVIEKVGVFILEVLYNLENEEVFVDVKVCVVILINEYLFYLSL